VRRSVLVVDDHAEFREAARALLEADGFDVVGVAGNGDHACVLVARLHPGLVLLDIRLPGEDGFAVAERLANCPDPPHVVLISSRDAADYGARVSQANILGFLSKGELSGAALRALLPRP
jgi:DNA-binding NarL/FixJ family response regulator